MADNTVQRFFGGSPTGTLVRLVFVSLVVGAVLMWLEIEPTQVFHALERMVDHLWSMGFDAIRVLGRYLLAGAVIVVPIWLVARLFSLRGSR